MDDELKNYLVPAPTKSGIDLEVKVHTGQRLEFTKIVFGNGVPDRPNADMTALANPRLEVRIASMEKKEGFVLLKSRITSRIIDATFNACELGVYAQGDDEVEVLHSYRYAASVTDLFPASGSGSGLDMEITVAVIVSSVEKVTAIMVEGDAYALKEDFDEHVGDTENPHRVTPEQLHIDAEFLSNLAPNVEVNYSEAEDTAALTPGETFEAALGKIAAAVRKLISHIGDTENPHRLTAAKVGAAATSHTHSAADINQGTLGVKRGGTGKAKVTKGAILKGNDEEGFAEISGTGALYATTKNVPEFGTLPASCGGTGQTSLDSVTVGKAKSLNTPRKLKVALGSTADKTFDGSENVTEIPVGGTLPVENGGTGVTSLEGTDYSAAKPRKIYAGTGALTAGSSNLASGVIYLQYI